MGKKHGETEGNDLTMVYFLPCLFLLEAYTYIYLRTCKHSNDLDATSKGALQPKHKRQSRQFNVNIAQYLLWD